MIAYLLLYITRGLNLEAWQFFMYWTYYLHLSMCLEPGPGAFYRLTSDSGRQGMRVTAQLEFQRIQLRPEIFVDITKVDQGSSFS